MCAQKPGTAGDPKRQQSPAAAAPGRRAGRGGRARPQAARRPAPQQRQQPGHGVERDPRGSPKERRLRTGLDRGSGTGLSRAPPRVLQTRGPGAGHHALGGPARRSPPSRARSASRRPLARENFLCRGQAGSSERAGGASGRLPVEERRRGRARRACLIFQRDESPRAALLRRRPPPAAAFPPSGLTPASLGRAAAPSKQPRRDNQAVAAAATPSGGARDRRAGQRGVGGAWAGLRRRRAAWEGAHPGVSTHSFAWQGKEGVHTLSDGIRLC